MGRVWLDASEKFPHSFAFGPTRRSNTLHLQIDAYSTACIQAIAE
jgi:hypothetical protein